MATMSEYFINNGIRRIIKYLCYAEPDISFGESVIDCMDKYIKFVHALVAC